MFPVPMFSIPTLNAVSMHYVHLRSFLLPMI